MTPKQDEAADTATVTTTEDPWEDVAGEVVVPRQVGKVELYDRSLFPDSLFTESQDVGARFARRFMKAATLDDLFSVLEGNSSKGLVGHKVRVDSVEWLLYESDEGPTPNAICEAVNLDTGEQLEFATTSTMCTLFIRRAELIKALPFEARITEKTTRRGRAALNFERV